MTDLPDEGKTAMRLRVATWNIWPLNGDHRGRYRDIVSELRSVSADIVGLVEIWRDEHEVQIEDLARDLGYPHLASADIGLVDGVPWGVGVLSRLPIVRRQRLEFEVPFPGEPPAVALVTTVESPAGAFDFVSMCEWGIGLSWVGSGRPGVSRLPTYQALTSTIAADEHRISPIVVGDLNDVPDSADIRAITGKEPGVELAMVLIDTWERVHGPGGGWTADNLANPHLRGGAMGRRRIDYILTGMSYAFDHLWRANDVTVFGTSSDSGEPPSDHYGVHADLELVGPRHRPSDNHVIDR